MLQEFLELRAQYFERTFAFGELSCELVTTQLQLLELVPQTLEAGRDRVECRALGFHRDRNMLRAVAIALRLLTLEAQILTQAVALLFELHARRFELRHLLEAFLEASTCGGDGILCALLIGLQLRGLRLDLASTLRGLFGAAGERSHLRGQLAVRAVQTVHIRLQRIAATLELHQPLADLGSFALQGFLSLFRGAHGLTQLAHFLFTTDDAGMHVLVAAHAQPVATDPDAIACDDGFASAERSS